jgi:phosphoglycolate phosphatase-like HAD superfamily hydrolase
VVETERAVLRRGEHTLREVVVDPEEVDRLVDDRQVAVALLGQRGAVTGARTSRAGGGGESRRGRATSGAWAPRAPTRVLAGVVLMLFDIDGTLLRRAHVEHRIALAEAVREVWDAVDPGDSAVPAAGRTDVAIARDICLLGGVTAAHFDERLDDFFGACATAYDRRAPADLRDRHVPHVEEVLAELAARPGVRLSLVTGNLEAVAWMKLERAGLDAFFPAGQGAFGSDAEDRTELPAIARARAGNYPRAKTVIIGDTPRDIACARADGLRCIAVATGPFTAEQLAGADAVLDSAHALLDVL